MSDETPKTLDQQVVDSSLMNLLLFDCHGVHLQQEPEMHCPYAPDQGVQK